MDWKELGESVAKLGLPLLGAALPIPGGEAIGAALASHIGATSGNPEDILATLTQSADAVQKAKEFELTHQETMLKITSDYQIAQRQADSADVTAVNQTMQAEAANSANENWWQKGWRPFNGYVVGVQSAIACNFVCYLLYKGIMLNNAAAINSIPAVAIAIASILAIPGAAVGITAWHRGVVQRIEAQK